MPASATEKVRLAEYASLRQETSQRAAIQQALVALNLTVAGTVTGVVVSGTGHEELFVLVALAASTFGLLWLNHHLSILQIATYVMEELWLWAPSWERYLRDHEKPLWWQRVYRIVMALVFIGVAAAALVISSGVGGAVGFIWWVGVGLTALTTFSFIALFVRGPGTAK